MLSVCFVYNVDFVIKCLMLTGSMTPCDASGFEEEMIPGDDGHAFIVIAVKRWR